MGATERHLHRTGKLEQSGDGEADRTTTDARRNEGWGAVRPLERQAHVLAWRMLHVHVAPAILAADEPSDWQSHSLEGMNRQRDGHVLN
jgi:hypothetical protein